jgi:hypothetical protein
MLKKAEKGKHEKSTLKYSNPHFVKSLLPFSMIDEFNKFLGEG